MGTLQTVFLFTLVITFSLAQERPTDTGRSCPPGTFDTGNYCRRCPAGAISSGRSNFWCTKCPTFRFPKPDQSGCERCPPGSFLKSPTNCEPCTTRGYSSQPESLNCTKCPPRTSTFFGKATSVSNCRRCILGSYINNWAGPYGANCKWCLPATFGSNYNSCDMCPPGTSSSKLGATSCHVCPSGTRALHSTPEAFRYTGCKKCEEGTFNPLPKSDTCKKCPPGSNSHPSGTACIAKCEKVRCPGTCPPGFGIVSSAKEKNPPCVRCPHGKVSFANSLTGCHFCWRNLIPNAMQSDCGCPPGFGLDYVEKKGLECVKCKAPFVSRENMCVCLPPNKKLFRRCECPPFTILKGASCVPCRPFELKKAIAQHYAALRESKTVLCGLNKYFDVEAGKCLPSSMNCILCNENYWYDKKAGKCLPCPPGTTLPKGSPGKCRPCKNPWIDSNGERRCDCGPGTEPRDFKCVPCRKGYYRNESKSVCRKCNRGYFANRTGMTRCKRCPQGRRYVTDSGLVQCPRRCPAYSKSWSIPNKGLSGCRCIPGEKVKTTCESGRCHAVGCECPMGTEMKDGRCENCKKGWASMGGPEGKCMICGLNEVAHAVGSSKCTKCEVSFGSLSLRKGGTKCLSCPSGSFVSLGGKCEKCPVGHRVRNGECVRCINSVSTGGDMGYCKVCRDGKVPNKSLSACT